MWPYVRISSASSIAPLRAGTGPSTSRASSSRATSDAVQRTSCDVVGPRPVERVDLGLVEQVAGGEAQQRPRAEQVVEQLGRREHRPHPLERGAHLGHATQLLAQLAAGDVAVARRRGERGEDLALDEAAPGVVAAEAAARRLDDARRLLDREPQVAGAERHDEVVAQRPLAVARRPCR